MAQVLSYCHNEQSSMSMHQGSSSIPQNRDVNISKSLQSEPSFNSKDVTLLDGSHEYLLVPGGLSGLEPSTSFHERHLSEPRLLPKMDEISSNGRPKTSRPRAPRQSEITEATAGSPNKQQLKLSPFSQLFDRQPDMNKDSLFASEKEALQVIANGAKLRRERYNEVLKSLSSHDLVGKLRDLCIIELISDLKSKDSGTQKSAAHSLRLLAKNSDENRVLIADAGGIPQLANAVAHGEPEVVDEAVTALLNLSLNENNKLKLTDHGAAEPLVEALVSGSWKTRENAAYTLFSMSIFDDNKIIIGSSGAVPPLLQVLEHGSEQGKRDACKALYNLSIVSTNRTRMIDAGAVRILIQLTEDPGTGMAEKAVCVLSNLSYMEEGRRAIAENQNGVLGLVEVVDEGTDKAKENAAAALWQLAKNSQEYLAMIREECMIPTLVTLSQSGTPRARDKASQLLKIIRSHE